MFFVCACTKKNNEQNKKNSPSPLPPKKQKKQKKKKKKKNEKIKEIKEIKKSKKKKIKKEASKGEGVPRGGLQKLISFIEKLQDVVQQLRPKKIRL